MQPKIGSQSLRDSNLRSDLSCLIDAILDSTATIFFMTDHLMIFFCILSYYLIFFPPMLSFSSFHLFLHLLLGLWLSQLCQPLRMAGTSATWHQCLCGPFLEVTMFFNLFTQRKIAKVCHQYMALCPIPNSSDESGSHLNAKICVGSYYLIQWHNQSFYIMYYTLIPLKSTSVNEAPTLLNRGQGVAGLPFISSRIWCR